MAVVLVVDDEPDIRELVRINLEQAGHQVVTAANGAEALASVRADPPDAMFLDVRMPGLDGWAVLEELKRDGTDLSEIPVFMVTAADEPESRLRGGIEGALQYITKPFDPQELVRVLELALDPAAPPEREQRRQVQSKALVDIARFERTGTPDDADPLQPRPVRLTRLEHWPTTPSPPPRVRAARERVGELTPKQRQLLEALAERTPVTAVAQQLGMSRSNVYAILRRICRRLGLKNTDELLALLRQGAILQVGPDPGSGT